MIYIHELESINTMKSQLKMSAMAITITLGFITAGSASACGTLGAEAQVLHLHDNKQKDATITHFGCDEVDVVAEELRLRLDSKGSIFSKIIKSASRPFKAASRS